MLCNDIIMVTIMVTNRGIMVYDGIASIMMLTGIHGLLNGS